MKKSASFAPSPPDARKAFIPLFLLATFGITSLVLSQDFQLAPLNPDFIAYTNAITSKTLLAPSATEGRFGYRPSPVDLSHLKQSAISALGLKAKSFASAYDLRTLGRVTSVKNQGVNGTCWAHAACASLESCLLPGETYDFSENNLVNLHGFDWGFDGGGNSLMATAYLVRWSGPVNEADDPYPNPGGSSSNAAVKHVQQVLLFPPKTAATDNAVIKQAVMDYGGVFVNYFHDDTFYNSTYRSYYCSGAYEANHAVMIVGWNDDFPCSNFNSTPAGNGAYIVKNSWGTEWGESGYFYVSYFDTVFAWKELAVFNNAEPTNTYKTVYQYDPLGWIGSLGYGTTNAWGANIFVSNASERLGAVGFYAPTLNTSYTLYVYTGVTNNKPCSGTLAATKSGLSLFAGYMTIPLDTTVALTSNKNFSIVLSLTTPDDTTPLACECSIYGYSTAVAWDGQSFMSADGNSWNTLHINSYDANFCAKAYVPTDQTLPTVTINQAVSQSDPTVDATIHFTVTFSEAVTRFTSDDVTLSGTAAGAKTVTVSGSGATYNVAVTGMTGDGTVIATIAANTVTDGVGNPNSAASPSTDNVVTYLRSTSQGTPYVWLSQYGLVSGDAYEAAAAADTDSDGQAAWKEYVAGTVPTNPASVFRTTLIQADGQTSIHWTPDLTDAVPARVYSVLGTPSLLSDFLPLSNNIPAGTPISLPSFTTNRFFRIGVDVQ